MTRKGLAGAVIVFVCVAVAGSMAAHAPEASQAAAPATRANAPVPFPSYPLNQVNENLAAQAERDACAFERRQVGRRRGLLIFLVGRVSRQNGKFGVGSDPNFRPNNRVYRALRQAGRAYARCRSSRQKKVDIAYGVTNYKLSLEIASQRGAGEAGAALRRVADKLAGSSPRGVGAAVATDIEPGWDHPGSGIAIALSHGAAATKRAVYGMGTVGRCPPFGQSCQGNWTAVDVGRVSQDKGVIALPQIYYPRQAKTWARTAKRWDRAGRNCKPKRRPCFKFGGVTAHPQGCAGVEFSPSESWKRMRGATGRRVGRTIIYFNPRRVGCRSDADDSEEPALAAEADLPLMPEVVPAEVIRDPDPVVSDDILTDVTNAWRVGSHREYTWVFAGRAGSDPADPSGTGRLVITREVYRRDRLVTPTYQVVDVPGGGALRITGAPTGARHVRSAHDQALISLEGEDGRGWELDVGTASVTSR